MIYLTGDTHGGININKLSNAHLKQLSISLTKNDYVIILGDFGLPFLDSDASDKNGEYNYWINWLAAKPYTVLWLDGNHENFNYWEKQKVTEWNGGKVQVHPDAPNVIHLMRGEIYTIEDKKFFVFGGAASHDKQLRTPNKTWWSQEEATESEIENALKNLERNNYTVDYILSHTVPKRIAEKIFKLQSKPDKTEDFLDTLVGKVSYKVWFAGHIHMQFAFDEINLMTLYEDIGTIEDFSDLLLHC